MTDIIMKIVLVGDSGVGKTSLIQKYMNSDIDIDTIASTVALDYDQKDVVIDSRPVKFRFFDTAGQERYNSLVQCYYNGSNGFILVFDLTSHESFTNIEKWINEIKSREENPTLILVGNKSDLENKQVTDGEAQNLASKYNTEYIQTSAKLGKNINEAFQLIENICFTSYNSKELRPELTKNDQSGGCC